MVFYSIVAAMGAVVLIYFLSALSPIPWYIYPPFIAVFILAYFWGKVINIFHCWRNNTSSSRSDSDGRGNDSSHGRRI
ncbi:MAG: hypothetical protein J7K75_08055 [Desulfuromonas sp.]|nr:hypothetical protein [Desulfuromonas sp.]